MLANLYLSSFNAGYCCFDLDAVMQKRRYSWGGGADTHFRARIKASRPAGLLSTSCMHYTLLVLLFYYIFICFFFNLSLPSSCWVYKYLRSSIFWPVEPVHQDNFFFFFFISMHEEATYWLGRYEKIISTLWAMCNLKELKVC